MVGVPGVIRQFERKSWGYLDPQAVLIPEALKQRGYHTAIIGKWHLGDDPFETEALESFGNREYNELRTALMDHIRESGSIPWQAAPKQ